MQIQCPGLAAFGVNDGDASGSLIDLALIDPQGRNFADPQPCPIAERKDRSETVSCVLFNQLLQDEALLLREFGRGHYYHRGPLH
jgi:hypothetical protein